MMPVNDHQFVAGERHILSLALTTYETNCQNENLFNKIENDFIKIGSVLIFKHLSCGQQRAVLTHGGLSLFIIEFASHDEGS
jgi:hypothetical protein